MDYWIFACAADRGDWKIGDVTLNRQKVGSGGSWKERPAIPVLCATRARLMLLLGDDIHQWLYRDVRSAGLRDKDAAIEFANGDTLQFRVNAKGPRMMDVARQVYWAGSSNTVERVMSSGAVGQARSAQAEFMGIVGDYLLSIARYGKA